MAVSTDNAAIWTRSHFFHAMLAGVVRRARLSNHADAHLPGIGGLFLDLAGDVARQHHCLLIGNLVVFDQNPQLAAGLNRIGFLDAGNGLTELL